ncbi:hypothetical protein E1B28_011121 [Marasmius oreades]|uniref:Zn(2)-C6 fungal-type domain-containing protein n=1 Tax=Marasmius oreades TaxID=181124 RepID=A0A9P7RUG8_9AGAR|nr:uncharacterized protein E1B28_011121 [Marasmius oreades]KAG7089436.1 hypothetical protein E1B28_011121 [Marasmius oreades]
MPPVAKPPSTKKAPKAKGAVRAKSGCYTCRIRRKKCDERPDDQGRCETCVRLRLQCLGFGAKRPDWLRESSNVSDIRGKIKQFLASQGMIKGHSGPSSRTAPPSEEQTEERVTLKLASEGYPSSASESPPNNLLVLSNGEDIRHSQVSNVRGEEGPWGSPSFPNGTANYDTQPILHHSPQANRQESPPFYPQEPAYDPSLMNHNSTTLAPWPPPPTPIDTALIPIHASSYGTSYSYTPVDDEMFPSMATFGSASSENPNSPTNVLLPTCIYGHGATDEWTLHYRTVIIEKQYQLANDPIMKVVLESVQSGTARSAAQLLALVHFERVTSAKRPYLEALPALKNLEISNRYKQLKEVLNKEHHDYNDAVGALNVISAFLFDGGCGDWHEWLKIAVGQSREILSNTRFLSYKDALANCTGLEQFIVKTTIWFDVLASVTTMEPPALSDVIQDLFDPSKTSSIHDLSSNEHAEALSMMTVMGCEGRIIWALARISSLAKSKDELLSRGALDTTALVQRASLIEAHLRPPDASLFASELPHRQLVSEVFRNAARLYLFTVLHGDYPNVRPISEAVEATSAALQQSLSLDLKDRRIVIRSTVFALFMCGCLCRDKETQRRKFDLLMAGQEAGRVPVGDNNEYGNYKGVLNVIEQVWAVRARSPQRESVPWRRMLWESKLLLV